METISAAQLWRWFMWRHGLELDETPGSGEFQLFAEMAARDIRADVLVQRDRAHVLDTDDDVEICRRWLQCEYEYVKQKRAIGLPLSACDKAVWGNLFE